MSCIFESNLRNNPMHNRHILREEFGNRPFMPEDPTDGNPEEMPEAEVADDLSDAQNDIDQEKVVQIYAEKVRWPEDSDGDPDNYEEETEDMGEKTFDDAEEVYKQLVDLGVQQDMKATGSTWWQSEVEQDYTEGWEITYTIHPQSGFTQEDIDYINGRIRGDIESPDPKFSKWDRDDDYGTEGDEPQEDVVNMESCVMGSNLLGHGGYGRAILREMYEDEDGYEDPEATDDPINTEEDEAFGEPPEQDIGMETSDTIGERIASMFDGSEETINDAIDFMQTNGFNVDAPADTVDNATWKELFDYIAPTSDVDSMMNDFTGKPMMNDEDAERAEEDAANDYYEEHPEEDDSWDTDAAQLPESFELHSMLTVEGEPKYEEPEVKKEPKPKAPALTAKRNRRLRSKTRNIQLWNNKKKCFDPKYINTRFTKMSDANEAIKRLGESAFSDLVKEEALKELQLDESHYLVGNEIRMVFDFKSDWDYEEAKRLFDELFTGKTAFDNWESDFSPIWMIISPYRNQFFVYSSLGKRKTAQKMKQFRDRLYAHDISCHVKVDGEVGGWTWN